MLTILALLCSAWFGEVGTIEWVGKIRFPGLNLEEINGLLIS